MSDVVDFLEKMGQDAHLREASDAELAAALEEAGVDPAAQATLLTRDAHAIGSLLGADPNTCCLVRGPDEDEETEEEDDEGEDDDEDDT